MLPCEVLLSTISSNTNSVLSVYSTACSASSNPSLLSFYPSSSCDSEFELKDFLFERGWNFLMLCFFESSFDASSYYMFDLSGMLIPFLLFKGSFIVLVRIFGPDEAQVADSFFFSKVFSKVFTISLTFERFSYGSQVE